MPSFDALMELANQQTTASQIAFAKENQIRQAREKVKRLEEERKEKERMRSDFFCLHLLKLCRADILLAALLPTDWRRKD
jgi:hypothetical protein